MSFKDLENRFTFHPASSEQAELYQYIRAEARNFAEYLDSVLPESREKSLAVTHLEETVFWANASISRNSNG